MVNLVSHANSLYKKPYKWYVKNHLLPVSQHFSQLYHKLDEFKRMKVLMIKQIIYLKDAQEEMRESF